MGYKKKNNTHTWTEEQEDIVKRLWKKKRTAGYIAAILSRIYHRNFTRNSVIGKKNRLGLKGDREVIWGKKFPVQPPVKQICTRVPLRDVVDGQCRYSQDTGRYMKVCGAPTYKHHPYCRSCCLLAYEAFERGGKEKKIYPSNGKTPKIELYHHEQPSP